MILPPRKSLVAIALATTISTVGCIRAEEVSDSFDRMQTSDITPNDIPNPIGPQYTIASGSWSLKSKKGVTYLMAGNPGIMYENTVKTDGGKKFVLSADVLIGGPTRGDVSSPRNGGIVFHYVDGKNYCALLYRVYEGANDDVLEVRVMKDGKLSSAGSVRTLDLSTSTFYTMKVESSVDGIPGKYRYSLTAPGEKEPIYSDSFIDASLPQGYSGFLRQGSATALFSNYVLKTGY